MTAAARMAASLGRDSVGESVKSVRMREVEMRFAVGEILDLEVLERLVHRLDAAEQRGHDDDRAELRGDAAVPSEIQLGQTMGRQERGEQLVHRRDARCRWRG